MSINWLIIVISIIFSVIPSGIVLLVAYIWIEGVRNAIQRSQIALDSIRTLVIDTGTRASNAAETAVQIANRISIAESNITGLTESLTCLNNKWSSRLKAEESAERRKRKKEEEPDDITQEQLEIPFVPPLAMAEQNDIKSRAEKQTSISGRLTRVSRFTKLKG